jgi:hypothetical protein
MGEREWGESKRERERERKSKGGRERKTLLPNFGAIQFLLPIR